MSCYQLLRCTMIKPVKRNKRLKWIDWLNSIIIICIGLTALISWDIFVMQKDLILAIIGNTSGVIIAVIIGVATALILKEG